MITAEKARIKSDAIVEQATKALTDQWVQQQVPAIEKTIEEAIQNGMRICHLTVNTMQEDGMIESPGWQIDALVVFLWDHHYEANGVYNIVDDIQSEYHFTIAW
jgi:hypothetical protein